MPTRRPKPSYTRDMRERRMAQGVCTKCAARPPAANRQMCEPCAADHRAYVAAMRAERAAAGVCTTCADAEPTAGEKCARCARADILCRYGLTLADDARLWVEQEGRCACCGQEFAGTPDIDHDHSMGLRNPYAVRGLVCRGCNQRVDEVERGTRVDAQVDRYLARERPFRAA